MTFAIGDFVELVCHDGAAFSGWIGGWTEDYVVVGGRGFPHADVLVMQHA